MLKQYTAALLMATALAAGPALAQTNPPGQAVGGGTGHPGAQAALTGNRAYLTDETPGTWRVSKVIGLGVYNNQNERIGDINEVLFDRSGRVEGVVIGVGGFLGLGQRNVAVPYNELQWAMAPANANQGVAGSAAPASGLGTTANSLATAAGQAADTAGNAISGAANSAGAALGSSTAASRTGSTTLANGIAAYPDHAILPNASKQQLQNAPQFNYGSAR